MIDIRAAFLKASDEPIVYSFTTLDPTDLKAFVMLHALAPSGRPIVSAAEHDEIYLGTDVGALARVATYADVQELVRLGVRYDTMYDCLAMFV